MLRGLLVLIAALWIGAAASASPLAGRSSTATAARSNGGRALTKQDAEAWLDGYMPYALDRGDIPGAVVTIVKDGQVVTEKGYGFADVARRVHEVIGNAFVAGFRVAMLASAALALAGSLSAAWLISARPPTPEPKGRAP